MESLELDLDMSLATPTNDLGLRVNSFNLEELVQCCWSIPSFPFVTKCKWPQLVLLQGRWENEFRIRVVLYESGRIKSLNELVIQPVPSHAAPSSRWAVAVGHTAAASIGVCCSIFDAIRCAISVVRLGTTI